MPPRADRTRTTQSERRALQDVLAWPIALTLLVAAAVMFFLPRMVPAGFLTVAIGATFAIVTVALVALLAWLIERWLGRHAALLARDAERQVQAHGLPGLLATDASSALTPLASAYADAGARAALRTAARESADFLARLGTDAARATERAIEDVEVVATQPSPHPGALVAALAGIEDCTAALRRVTAPVPAPDAVFDVVPELRAYVASLRDDGARARVSLTVEVERGQVLAEPERLRQHLHELIDLARHASPPASTVTVHVSRVFRASLEDTPVRRTGDSRLTIVPRASADAMRAWVQRAQPGAEVLSIIISDAGRILGPDEQRRALDAFAVARPGDRLGVALATIRRTVTESGGLLWIDGAREGGTSVHLLLPFAG